MSRGNTMNRKIIFLDIDGTLVSDLSEPSPLVKEAVRRTRKKGNRVFLCTGRNMPIIGRDILQVGFDGVVASAGAYVEAECRVLLDRVLPEETIQKCLSVFHENGMYCRIETPEGIYTDPQMEALLKQAQADRRNSELIRMQKEIEKGIPIRPYAEYPGQGAYKICFTSTNLDAIEKTKIYLQDRFHYAVFPYGDSTSCFNGEIIPKEVDKGKGMELVCGYYGATLNDTVAFGDSMNDLPMMKAAGVCIAMGNACEELKQMADRVCESVREDGVYHEMYRMGLL